MPALLILDLAAAAPASWRAALEAAGLHLGAACDGHALVRRTNAENPDGIVVLAAPAGSMAALEAALAPWAGAPPCPVALLTPGPLADEDDAARTVELGVHHVQALPADADAAQAATALALARAFARARWQREAGLRHALERATGQLDERKWVERAKGVLMSARGMDEDEAFCLLRGAAMNVNLRVGEVSRAVIETAQWADAMNRAGQLRMLSQRCVRLIAQRLLRIDARAADALIRHSAERVQDNLDMLARQCADTPARPACAEAARCWRALAQALEAPRLDLPALLRIDRHAAALLETAERLTDALQDAAGHRALGIVNQCGRQRMRVQRVAKESLLAALHASVDDAPALARRRDTALADFEHAQRELEQAPLTSPEIRGALAQVRDEWLRLLGGLRAPDPADGRRALVHASEAMLERLDALTAAYEHSLQVLMG